MNILVTGASGFIGRQVVRQLADHSVNIYGVTRDISSVQNRAVKWLQTDIHNFSADVFDGLYFDVVVHLAWQDLNDYNSDVHLAEATAKHLEFLRFLVSGKAGKVIIAGTCLEYGKQSGELAENMRVAPTTSYAKAKNQLRLSLASLQAELEFTLIWCRFFYLYGEGQRESSFVPLILRAIESKQDSFAMSVGTQTRDYLDVAIAAGVLTKLAMQEVESGIYNVCSGIPVTVKSLAEKLIRKKSAQMRLELGVYPIPDYEPMHFWGSNSKVLKALNMKDLPDSSFLELTDSSRKNF